MYISRISRQLGGFQRKGFVLPIPSRTVAGLGDYRPRNFVLPTDQLRVMPAGAVFVGTPKKKGCTSCWKKPGRLGRLGDDLTGSLYSDFTLPSDTIDTPLIFPDVPAYTPISGGIGTTYGGVTYGAAGPPAIGQTIINPAGVATPSSSNIAQSLIQAAGQVGAARYGRDMEISV